MFVTLPRQLCETGPTVFVVDLCCAIVCPSSPAVSLFLLPQPVCLSPSNPPFLSLPPPFSLSTAQDESASVRPCSSSLSGAPWWSSSSFSNWAPTAGWNYSSPPKLSPLFLNKCGCSNRGELLIHLSRAVRERVAIAERDREPNKPQSL